MISFSPASLSRPSCTATLPRWHPIKRRLPSCIPVLIPPLFDVQLQQHGNPWRLGEDLALAPYRGFLALRRAITRFEPLDVKFASANSMHGSE